MTKPYNFDIKCLGNSESYDRHGSFGTKLRGGQIFLITVGGFYNEREYSGADWPVLLLNKGQFWFLLMLRTSLAEVWRFFLQGNAGIGKIGIGVTKVANERYLPYLQPCGKALM